MERYIKVIDKVMVCLIVLAYIGVSASFILQAVVIDYSLTIMRILDGSVALGIVAITTRLLIKD